MLFLRITGERSSYQFPQWRGMLVARIRHRHAPDTIWN
jgi:hypothetical protein